MQPKTFKSKFSRLTSEPILGKKNSGSASKQLNSNASLIDISHCLDDDMDDTIVNNSYLHRFLTRGLATAATSANNAENCSSNQAFTTALLIPKVVSTNNSVSPQNENENGLINQVPSNNSSSSSVNSNGINEGKIKI